MISVQYPVQQSMTMSTMRFFTLLAFAVVVPLLPGWAAAQKQKTAPPAASPALVRTTMRNETRRLGYGGTLTIVGAPDGSITIEGWSRSEVEVRAEIQLRGDTEQDLDRLATVNGFVLDEDLNHLRVLTTGTYDRAFMKAKAKIFSKTLLRLP